MISKIVSLKNIGNFVSCTPPGDTWFRRLTLIHAPNGMGKTTLCAVLRSLKANEPTLIAERRTLSASSQSGEPEVHIEWAKGRTLFKGGKWDPTPEVTLSIFDSTFVSENVYSGDDIDHSQKKGLYRVMIGAVGVGLAKAIDTLDARIKEINSGLADLKKVITPNAGKLSVDKFVALKPDVGSGEEVSRYEKEVEARKKSGEIAVAAILTELSCPKIPAGLATTLVKDSERIAQDAEARVWDHIGGEDAQRRRQWVSEGIPLMREDMCPFCGVPMDGNSLVGALKAYFNEGYLALARELSVLGEDVGKAFGDLAMATLQQRISGNVERAAFWGGLTNLTAPTLSFDKITGYMAALREGLGGLVVQKRQQLVEAVVLGESYNASIRTHEELEAAILTYNSMVQAANAEIQKIKLSASGDLMAAEGALAKAKQLQLRSSEGVNKLCTEFSALTLEKTDAEKQKAKARAKLDAYTETVLATYQESINGHLKRFGAGFRIANTKHTYQGGSPSSQFHIDLNGVSVDPGSASTPPGTPCFRNTLSAGDRSALALAFFVAALEADPKFATSVVVFDDPFTSLDRSRRQYTEQLIRRQADRVAQVIVLSHDPHFLRAIFDECLAKNTKALEITRCEKGTTLHDWDIANATRTPFLKDLGVLQEYVRVGSGRMESVNRAIRPVVEGYLQHLYPGQFDGCDGLGGFVRRIESSPPGSALYESMSRVQALKDLNEYARKHHHPNEEDIDPIELRVHAVLALEIVGSGVEVQVAAATER